MARALWLAAVALCCGSAAAAVRGPANAEDHGRSLFSWVDSGASCADITSVDVDTGAFVDYRDSQGSDADASCWWFAGVPAADGESGGDDLTYRVSTMLCDWPATYCHGWSQFPVLDESDGGTCAAIPQLGESCNSESPCASPFITDAPQCIDGTCVWSGQTVGDWCGDTTECVDGATCDGGFCVGVGEGESCADAPCALFLYCAADETCAPQMDDGSPCAAVGAAGCRGGSVCLETPGGDGALSCQRWASLPDGYEQGLGTQPTPIMACASGSHDNGVCSLTRSTGSAANGEACGDDADCEDATAYCVCDGAGGSVCAGTPGSDGDPSDWPQAVAALAGCAHATGCDVSDRQWDSSCLEVQGCSHEIAATMVAAIARFAYGGVPGPAGTNSGSISWWAFSGPAVRLSDADFDRYVAWYSSTIEPHLAADDDDADGDDADDDDADGDDVDGDDADDGEEVSAATIPRLARSAVVAVGVAASALALLRVARE